MNRKANFSSGCVSAAVLGGAFSVAGKISVLLDSFEKDNGALN